MLFFNKYIFLILLTIGLGFKMQIKSAEEIKPRAQALSEINVILAKLDIRVVNSILTQLKEFERSAKKPEKPSEKSSAEAAAKAAQLGDQLNEELNKQDVDLKIVSEIIKAGADLNKKDNLESRPLTIVINSIGLSKEYRNQKVIPEKGLDLLILLLQQKTINPNLEEKYYGLPLHNFLDLLEHALDNGFKFNVEKIIEILKLFILRGVKRDAHFYNIVQKYQNKTDIFKRALAEVSAEV